MSDQHHHDNHPQAAVRPDERSLCDTVEATLANVLEGRAEDALYEHIAHCDVCRDVRHEAQQAADEVVHAGADYQHPEDFEQRLLARLAAAATPLVEAAAEADGGRVRAGKTQPMSARSAPHHGGDEGAVDKPSSLTRAAEVAAANTAALATEPPAPSGVDPSVAAAARPARGGVLRWLRRPRNTALAGAAAAALAAAVVALAVGSPTTDAPEETAAVSGWQGTITKVRTAGVGGEGLRLCDAHGQACRTAAVGDAVAPGQQLRTDGRTRAHLAMGDGSRVVMDRDTVLTLSLAGPRRAALSQGAVVAAVNKRSDEARFDLPRGHMTVPAGKFALRSMGPVAAVDVSRGDVTLVDEQQHGVAVRAGEEGRSYPGVPPYAAAAPSLAQALAWGDDEAPAGPSEALRGLGELRAKKPGSQQERQGAVRLAKHHVKVRISGGFARTEVDEVFHNSSDEVLEGIYRFPLPPDAHIERLALEVDGALEEGAFVDRARAAAIWRGAIVNANRRAPRPREEIIWVPGPWRDPALLEWQRGGRFELRIFPIPKHGSRRVVLTYTQPVTVTDGTRRYVYPLAHDEGGSTQVDDFAMDVQLRDFDAALGVRTAGYEVEEEQLAGARVMRMRQRHFTPHGDLVVEYAAKDHDSEMTAWAYQPAALGAAADKSVSPMSRASAATTAGAAGAHEKVAENAPFITIALRPKLPRSHNNEQRTFAFVVDASRSMYGEAYQRASDLTARVVGELDRLDRFTVLACDTSCRSLSGGLRAPGYDAAREVRAFLQGVVPEGASDPVANVRDAMSLVSHTRRSVRLVYIGDGTPTVGQILPADLTQAASDVVGGRGTLTTVAIGSDADAQALRSLARGGGGAVVPYVPGRSASEVAFAVLGAAYGAGLRNVQVELPDGLVAAAPQQLDTILAGGEALLSARMTAPTVNGTVVLRGMVGEQPFEQRYPLRVSASSDGAHAFVPRVYAAARIADLEQRDDAQARGEAVALSGKYNVASRFTSLLVLESPAMFRAFGLDNVRKVAEWTGEQGMRGATAAGESPAQRALDARDAVSGPALAEAADGDHAQWSSGRNAGIGYGADLGVGTTAGLPSPAARPSPARPTPAPPAPPAVLPDVPAVDDRASEPVRISKRKIADKEVPRGATSMRRRRMVPMRRVFERKLTLALDRLTPMSAAADKLAAAELALKQSPNRRAAVADLFRIYSQLGRIEQAAALATRWSEKEALDPDALTARADVAAQRGQREQAIRILGSVVDVRPNSVGAHRRLARLHRWAGRPALGCRYSLAVSQMHPQDASLLAEAVFCARRTGESVLAERMLARVKQRLRRLVEAKLRAKKEAPPRLRGDLQFVASWEGSGNDLDIALIHPQGHWVSWLGAPTRALISAEDVTSQQREGLALMGSQAGEYVIEIVRAAGAGPVRGKLEVRGPGVHRSIDFVLEGERVRLGIARVWFQSKLVPLRGGGWR